MFYANFQVDNTMPQTSDIFDYLRLLSEQTDPQNGDVRRHHLIREVTEFATKNMRSEEQPRNNRDTMIRHRLCLMPRLGTIMSSLLRQVLLHISIMRQFPEKHSKKGVSIGDPSCRNCPCYGGSHRRYIFQCQPRRRTRR